MAVLGREDEVEIDLGEGLRHGDARCTTLSGLGFVSSPYPGRRCACPGLWDTTPSELTAGDPTASETASFASRRDPWPTDRRPGVASVYHGEVRRVAPPDDAGAAPGVPVRVKIQACNDRVCLKPEEMVLEVPAAGVL